MLGDTVVRIRAFHCSEGYRHWSPIRQPVQAPALVYEVTETFEHESGKPLYEARIFDAESGEMIHPIPYRSTLLAPLARWWSRETGTEPPLELVGEVPRKNRRRG